MKLRGDTGRLRRSRSRENQGVETGRFSCRNFSKHTELNVSKSGFESSSDKLI